MLVEMLKKNSILEHIDTGGDFGEQGMNTFVQSLPYLHGLRRFKLYSTHVVPPSMVSAITDAFEQDNAVGRYNTTLEKLDLRTELNVDRTRLDYLLELNRGGRRLLKEENHVPDSLWPLVLARSSHSPDVLSYCVREKPRLDRSRHFETTSSTTTTGKRKRDDSDS